MQFQFSCKEVRHYEGGSDIQFQKTSDAKDDPRGSIELMAMNSEVASQFVVGKSYIVDFSPATVAAV